MKRFVARYLDPASRLGEILFGLIMTLTVTLSAGLAMDEGRAGVRQLLAAAIGCNLAWGIIDAVMYVMNCITVRSGKRRLSFTKSDGKHHDSHNGIDENCKGESKRQHADAPLFESAGGVREKKDCREQDGVGEILAGNITVLARFGYFRSGLSIRLRGLAGAPNFIEVRDEWMRVSIWILKRPLREPGIVRFPHVGRKALRVKVRQFFVTRLLRREQLHEHGGMNARRLHSLDV
jgi:hypothetical protein